MQYPVIPCYIFKERDFLNNYRDFENAFKSIYPNYQVSYSFKTNYTPYVCKLIKELGGYAEVVSQMEYDLAKSIGFSDEKIIFNGPCKQVYPNCLLNVDSIDEIKKTGNNKIGLRLNVDVGQGFVSRFGISEDELDEAFELARDRIVGLHLHVSQARSLEAWDKRTDIMLKIADKYFGPDGPEYIDLGSGMYGDMDNNLKSQFNNVPSYNDYANVVARKIADHYKGDKKPILFTEPGTTLINKYFEFVCNVESIKNIKNMYFVTTNGSKHNLGEICELKNLPIEIIHRGNDLRYVENAKICGYTCLEHDVMLKDFTGNIAVNDIIVFKNVGGYSLVSKPPFIRPNYPVYSENGTLIKKQETLKEIFSTYE